MSRTSPGRYAIHEFAKNVYDVRVDDGSGLPLPFERPNPTQWNVASPGGAVRVRYKVFGDRLDGTFLAIDTTHAHLNVPASLMWARGFENRPATVTFDAPARWKVATQLHPTGDPRTFTAGSLAYLVDSPIELSDFTLRTFTVGREFRIALHHDGTAEDADRFAAGVEKIVREQRAIFAEFPAYETPFTFIADFLPWASFDGMEHRNSTVLTSPLRLRDPEGFLDHVGTAAHEFFHSWNVERIRPRSLEPFKLDAPNPSGELWLAEGFTQYYQPLTLYRAGMWDVDRLADRLSGIVETITLTPARKYRSAEEASFLSQYVDQSSWLDPTNFENHFFSYYEWGAAIALGLDLSLRSRSDRNVSLDDYMRHLWEHFGRVPPEAEGTVARPYTMTDLRDALARITGDAAFAEEFFSRYIRGREVVDYEQLLSRAGFVLRKRNPGRPWIGPAAFDFGSSGARVNAPTLEDTPLYQAGVDRDDVVVAFDGVAMTEPGRLEEAVQRRRPGDTVRVTIRRRGMTQELKLTIGENPRLLVVPAERTGRPLTAAERAFRDAWLTSKQ
jgi:predicted metalloprotease with PDZ domain